MQFYPLSEIKVINKKNNKYLLLLHGWGCNKEIFTQYINIYQKYYNIICFDLYGFGQSNEPKPFFDTYEYAMQIYLILHNRGICEVDVIAHSFGGRIATILAALFDIKINKMVLTGSAGLKPRRHLGYYIKVGKYKLCKKLRIKINNMGSDDYKVLSDNMKTIFVKVVNQYLDYLLPNVDTKTMLLWGANDKSTPLYMLKKYAAEIKKVNSIVIPGAEHFVIFSHIFICNNFIKEFLIYD